MKLGAETCFVGSGIFKSGDPAKRAKAIVESGLFFNDPKKLAEISRNRGEPMVGINVSSLDERDLLAPRGW
jgi:pyridoxal 5'-phosphate synthase pdxS subunit